jgi:hypothetical protein
MQELSRGSITPPEQCLTQKVAKAKDIGESFKTLEFGFRTDLAGMNYINPNMTTSEGSEGLSKTH